MFQYTCKNAERRLRDGTIPYFYCKKLDNLCGFQRICRQKRDVEHTALAPRCPHNPDCVDKQTEK